MARGWESKSVESQVEAAQADRPGQSGPPLDAEQAARLRRSQGLELSRRRVLQELESSDDPRHHQLLQQALAHLEAQLARAD